MVWPSKRQREKIAKKAADELTVWPLISPSVWFSLRACVMLRVPIRLIKIMFITQRERRRMRASEYVVHKTTRAGLFKSRLTLTWG